MLKLPWRASFAGVAAALLAAMSAASACTSFGGTENTTDAAADEAHPDGSGDAAGTPTADADDAEAPVSNDMFATSCGLWTNSGPAGLKFSTNGHGGSPGSCQLCETNAGGVPLARKAITPAPSGGIYTISAWVQADGDANGVTADVGFQLYDADGGMLTSHSGGGPVGSVWSQFGTTFEVGGAAKVVATIALLSGKIGQCIDFDDVVVVNAR